MMLWLVQKFETFNFCFCFQSDFYLYDIDANRFQMLLNFFFVANTPDQ